VFENKIPVTWTKEQFQNLEFKSDIFKDPEQTAKWSAAGIDLTRLTIDLHQLDTPLEWMFPILAHFDFLSNIKCCVHRLLPGYYLPTHYDLYGFYRKQNDINNINQMYRYIVFLEDGNDGHYLQVKDKVYFNWHAGECVGWNGSTLHSALNFGTTNRYTLQLTGFKK
jgi:hypothetical protein